MWIRRNNLAYLKSIFFRKLFDLPFLTIHQSLRALNLTKGKVLNFGAGPTNHYEIPFASSLETLDPSEKADFRSLHEIDQRKKYDYILCLEVLEHCKEPQFILESLRPYLGVGGRIIVSTPLNARVHPSPFDYHRFTPDWIKELASSSDFELELLMARGSNVTTITNKMIYLCAMSLLKPRSFIFGLCFAPFTLLFLLLAHLDLKLIKVWGDDPLGYFYLLKLKHS